jgi:hypothetical protein
MKIACLIMVGVLAMSSGCGLFESNAEKALKYAEAEKLQEETIALRMKSGQPQQTRVIEQPAAQQATVATPVAPATPATPGSKASELLRNR